jgi:hypothetical protein
MYVTVGKLGRNTIQVKSLVELQMDLQHQVAAGSKTAKPITCRELKIVTGNMYSKSFGQAAHSNCVPYL